MGYRGFPVLPDVPGNGQERLLQSSRNLGPCSGNPAPPERSTNTTKLCHHRPSSPLSRVGGSGGPGGVRGPSLIGSAK